jgi:hypothetical protein
MAMRDTNVEIASLWAEIDSLKVNVEQLQRRCRYLEELIDTFFDSPLWRRLLFVVDGWPADRIASRPADRPWRKWWTS